MIISNDLRPFLLKFMLSCCLVSLSTPSLAKTVLIYGDSVSAAYGINIKEGWASLLSTRLTKTHPHYNVINSSVSGETTGGGLIRLPKTLEIHKPNILILELGGNDGLRGYPISKIENNLKAMIRMAKSANIKILLIGMVLPPNYGRRYTKSYEALYQRLAAADDIEFLPFLLQGVTTSRSLLQADGLHPKKEAQPLILDNIWPLLENILTEDI